ncbi:hypothetical protein [Streptomyces sp. CC228A]|uniref:hypothetical protein n=1 Tax=Streptomyces sp. CC228A TaxID=2898186 RepID=UPI001F1C7FFF|nr:hypothetical protein [Streptomyces sp. CC228A]
MTPARASEPPPLPALPQAEGACAGGCPDTVDLLARLGPARCAHTYGAPRAGRALVGRAAVLRDALPPMHERGGHEVHAPTLARALRALDGERRTGRVTLPQDPVR